MKRGKDDEKMMGPMFPRLHVNDTEKGGPRAPPRNKMALYEQLSIPSQRYNHGVLPRNPSNTGSLVPHGSTNQGNTVGRNSWPLSNISPSTPPMAEKFLVQQSGEANLRRSLARHNEGKIVGDDDDFTVPVFTTPGMALSRCRTKNSADREKLTSANATAATCHPIVCEQSAVQNLELEDHIPSKCARLEKNSTFLRYESGNETQQASSHIGGEVERSRDANNGIDLRTKSYLTEDCDNPVDFGHDHEHCRTTTCGSPLLKNGELSDGVSETSMVDSGSCLDVSPDDVVGIIGQKHFWKARRAISNQQRVFAVQVFELHRLIKVQRLIAGSPHVLLEDSAYIAKPSPKSSPAKRLLPLEYVVKSLPHIANQKDDADKAGHRIEGSAENVLGRRTSLSSCNQISINTPFEGNQPRGPPMGVDTQVGPWCLPQGHQWLMPVMSPSEGLIYKPYPGPGLMGPAGGGGYGPYGPMPTISGSFMTPGYGVPGPPVGHGYFPPYGMPIMNPNTFMGPGSEKTNQFSGPGSFGEANTQQQSSCNNFPTQKDRAASQLVKHKPSKESRVQGSTASSRGVGRIAEERRNNPPFLLLSDPSAETEAPQPFGGKPTRVIKVVPHNPNLAPESAARIFQSIQEERKQYDST